uniref:WGS project CBMG000000000 data, contig CS5907-c002542 n=1 Tax=Fusarium acuminatum CS5907 TaxID=1318461 RepID=A0A090M9Q7_9HYPO|nr:unnamed protein product [Fusarium acuminatum CS5907]
MTPSKATISDGSQENDDTNDLVILSSPLSTPFTTSPELVSFQSLADQTLTPLSMMDDSCFIDTGKSNSICLESRSVSAGPDKPLASVNQSPSSTAGWPAEASNPSTKSQQTADPLRCTGTGAPRPKIAAPHSTSPSPPLVSGALIPISTSVE